jgi:DNA repair exonuclease SbcCD nuclease subunit
MVKKRSKRNKTKEAVNASDLVGILLIGDPHVDARTPPFRKDNYAETILGKIQWSLEYARDEKLQPVFLGDLFEKPRGNPNWIIHRLIEILTPHRPIGIFGNHDCADVGLNENDSLSILIAAGSLRLISQSSLFVAEMNQRDVIIGGSSYREPIPTDFRLPPRKSQGLFDNDPFVMWISHHDIGFPGYDNNRLDPHQISNVELLVNGHIHRRLESVKAGTTLWVTPGNIARRSRNEAASLHVPAVMRIDVLPEDYKISYIPIPHAPFDDVFHEVLVDDSSSGDLESNFVKGLAELTSRKTQSGVGLRRFLSENIGQFESPVADAVMELAAEVLKSVEGSE